MRGRAFLTVGLLAALAPTGWAAESVTLRNGFDLRCDHHAQVDSRVRLYLSAGGDSFIEVPMQDIAGVETVPDQKPASSPRLEEPPTAAPSIAKLSEADLGEILTRAGKAHN